MIIIIDGNLLRGLSGGKYKKWMDWENFTILYKIQPIGELLPELNYLTSLN